MHLSIKSRMPAGYSFNNECNNCVSLLINEWHNFNASLKRHSHGAICSQNSSTACSIKLMGSVRRYILNSSRRYSSSFKDILKSVLCIIENNSSCYSLPNSGIERKRLIAFYFWVIYEFLRVLSTHQKILRKHSKYNNNINELLIDVGVLKSCLTITEFLKATLGNNKTYGLSFISSQAIEEINSDCSYNLSLFTSFLQLSLINTLAFEDWHWICRTTIKTFGNILRKSACRMDILPEGQHTNKRFVLNPTFFLNLLYRFHLYFLRITELNKCHLVLFYYVLNKFQKNRRVNKFIESVLNLYADITIKTPGSISSTLKKKQNCSISLTGRGLDMTQVLELGVMNRDQISKVYRSEQANQQMFFGRISTNKEETEKIDGFEFVTFETEYDLMEYTRLEEMRTSSRTCSHTSPVKKIIPTKTKDITKIKGWKYKLFDSISKDDTEENNSVDSCKINELKDEENSQANNLNKTIFDITEEDIHLNKLFVKEHEGVIPTAFEICYRKEFIDVLQEINTLYSKSIKYDKDVNDIQAHTCNDDCVFNCPFVDDFLKKYENIEVSFDIPVADKEITPIPIKPTDTFTEIEGIVDTCKQKIKDKMNAKTNKMSPIKSSYDSRSFLTDKNGNKYILIRGEPIYLDVKQSCETQEVISNDNKNVFNGLDNSVKVEKTDDCKNIASMSDDKTVENNIQESNATNKLKTLVPLVNSHNKEAQSFNNSKFPKTENIPFVFSCKAKGDSHLSCLDMKNLDTFRLGVVVNIGYKRPIHKEIINNIELLKKDPAIIDEKWATLAVSALHSIKRKVSRILVPVVSPSILNVARSFVEETFKKQYKNIDSEVEHVMSDMLDYIERKESHEELEIPFDPDICNSVPFKSIQRNNQNGADTKLKRRISLTTANSLSDKCRNENEKYCGYEHCKKGCICHSLNGKFSLIHCGNEQCMFECSCRWVKRILFTGKDHTKQPSLMYDCTAGKSKREIKLPSRFRDVILGREMNVFDSCQTNLVNWKYLKNDLAMKESKIFPKKGSETQLKSPPVTNTSDSLSSVKLLSVILSPNKSGTSENASENSKTFQGHKKLNFSIERLSSKPSHRPKNSILKVLDNKSLQNDKEKTISLSEKLPFTSVFVWCTVHHCYNCECNGHVYLLKTSNLITNFQGKEQNLTLKDMSIMLNNKSKRAYYHMHNLQNHSARTCGMLYDYKKRNSSEIFRSKRIQEIENNVMSNTNGFVKVPSSVVPQKHFIEGDNILTTQAQNVGNTLSKAVLVPNSSIKKVLGSKKLAPADTKAINSSTKKPVFISLTDIALNKSFPTTSSSHSFVQNIKINKVQFDMRCPQGRKLELSNPTQNVPVKSENKRDIATNNDEEVPKNPRKRYRIGPAHFNAKRISRAITTNNRRAWPQPAAYTPREHHQTEPVQLQYGLLCLNEGFGYLPVKEFTINYIRVKDPLTDNIFQTFKDVAAANVWLNRFFKSNLLFENFNISLRWVVVKPGILTKLKVFDKTLLENKSVVVDKNGRLVDKCQFNKDYLGSINNIPMNSLKSECEPPQIGRKRISSPLSDDDCPVKKKKT